MFGQYYTPKKLVEESLYVTGINYEKIDELKIVDPACGAGAFLICVLDKIANKGSEKFLSVVENNIFGYDINPFAVMLTKLNILAVFFDKYKSIHISKFKSVFKNIKLNITGDDIQNLGIKPGEIYKEIFEYLIEQKISGKIDTKDDEILAIKNKFL